MKKLLIALFLISSPALAERGIMEGKPSTLNAITVSSISANVTFGGSINVSTLALTGQFTVMTSTMNVYSAGTVGIYTGRTPQARLEIGATPQNQNVLGLRANESISIGNDGSNGAYGQIGLGYDGGNNSPCAIGITNTSGSGNSKGDIVMGCRSTTADSAPPIGFRLDSNSNGTFNYGVTAGTVTTTKDVNTGAGLHVGGSQNVLATNTGWEFSGGATPYINAYNRNTSAYLPGQIDALTLQLNANGGGNVGIGATAPVSKLTILQAAKQTLGATASSAIHLDQTGFNGELSQIGFGYATGLNYAPAVFTSSTTSGVGNTTADFVWALRTVTTDSPPTEKMRLTSAGNLTLTAAAASGTILGLYSNAGASAADQWQLRSNSDDSFTLVNQNASGNGVVLAANNSKQIGIGTTNILTSLDVIGSITQDLAATKSCATGVQTNSTGTFTSCVASDISLKQDVAPLKYNPGSIDLLKPVTYHWKDSNRGVGEKQGFIAQDVEKVYPDAVVSAGAGLKGIDSNAMIAALVLEVQQLRKRVASLEKK